MNKNLFIILFFISLYKFGITQVCDGNLGENIFSIGDFGSGPDVFLPVDPGIAPGYTYTTNPPPPDGLYTITNNMGAWNNLYGTWLPLRDNSDDPNGYMMVVNASFEPGIFYEEEVTGLCENTLYEFSADIINVVRPEVTGHSLPNVSFLLNGAVQYNTNNIAQDGRWKKYGFTFITAPDQTTVTLTLRNNAPGGTGNDLALDNISFRPCGPDAFANAEKDFVICSNDNTPIKIEADTDENAAIQWQYLDTISGQWIDIMGANNTEVFHEDYDPGYYQYRYLTAGTSNNLLNEKCRVISDIASVTVIPIDFILYDTICQNINYEFGTQTLMNEGFYEETFIASNGCDSFVDLYLTIVPELDFNYNIVEKDPSCFGSSDGVITLENVSGGYPPYQFSLNGNRGNFQAFSGLTSGDYLVSIVDRHECSDDVALILDDPERFFVDAGPDTTIDLGATLDLGVLTNYQLSYIQWSGNNIECDICAETTIQPLEELQVTVYAVSNFNCETRDTLNIRLNELNTLIFQPNVFSPNEDGYNDEFYLQTSSFAIQEIPEMKVFDRWGNIVFEGRGSSLEDGGLRWDGRRNGQPAAAGVYSYYAVLKLINGEDYVVEGNVTLIR